MKTKSSSGFTLVEVMIASVILTGVVIAAFVTLFTASKMSSQGSVASDINTRGTRFLSLCRDDMAAAQYGKNIVLDSAGTTYQLGVTLTVPADVTRKLKNTAVAYQIPGDRNNAGVRYAGGIVVYGYNAPFNLTTDLPNDNYNKFYEDLVCYLRYEPDTVFKESTSSLDVAQLPDWDTNANPIFPRFPALTNPSATLLQSQILNIDLNGDGDRTDTYVRGKIVRYVVAPFGSPVAAAHPAFAINGQLMSSLLLSQETVSDMVMMRVRTEGPAGGPCDILFTDFDKHDIDVLNQTERDMIFRFVGATGTVEDPIYSSAAPLLELQPTVSTNARGLLISVTHGNYDGTPNGFVVRKNRQLVRTKTNQADPGGSLFVPIAPPVGP
jgi:prepilin-type N-terminal cleavage/methylation domain-containing protein